jgi:hypothetical protein
VPVPTLWIIDGFEHGLATAGVAGVYDSVNGSPAILTASPRPGKNRYLEFSAAAAAENVNYNVGAGNRQVTQSVYIRFPTSLPTAVIPLITWACGSGDGQIVFNNLVSQLRLRIGGAVPIDFGPTLVADQWYLIDAEFNSDDGAGNAVVKASVDEGTEGSTTRAQAAADITRIQLGPGSALTYTFHCSCWLASLTAGDYPIGPHTVYRLLPNADGTHNIATSGDFDSFTGTAFSNSTTNSWDFVDDAPVGVTNTADTVIRQELGSTTDYMEHLWENLPAGTEIPIDVRGYGSYVESAASGASLAELRLLLADNTVIQTVGAIDWIDSTEDPGTTVTVKKRMFLRPSGGWDRTKVDGLKSRLGFGDNNPDVNFLSTMLEVAVMPALPVGIPFQRQDGLYRPNRDHDAWSMDNWR